jgi:adenylate cyclase
MLENAAAGYGVFDLPNDRGGVRRRLPLVFNVAGALQQGLGLELLRVGSGEASIVVESDESGIDNITVGKYAIPTDREGRLWLRPAALNFDRYVSASDVLAGRLEPWLMSGKYVLIGTSAAGLADYVGTPIGQAMPTVEIQAQMLELFVNGAHPRRPEHALILEWLVILIGGLLLILVVPMIGTLWTLPLVVFISALIGLGSWYLYGAGNVMLDSMVPGLWLLLVYIFLVFPNYLREVVAKKRAEQAYRRARADEARLLEVAAAISSELNLDDLLEKIIASASEILNAERSSLFLYDQEREELWSRVGEGLDSAEIRFPVTAGLAGACFASGDVQHIPDAYADDRFNRTFDMQNNFRTRNMLSAPVTTKQGRKLGVVQVLNKMDGAFDDMDQNRLRAFCSDVAIALENAQLFEDVSNERNYNESILKSLSNGVVTIDVGGRIAKVNDAAARILGWDGKAPLEAEAVKVFGNGNSWIADSINKVEESGQLDLIVDAEVSLDDDTKVSVNMTNVPLIDVQEQRIGGMLVFEDISREKRMKSTMSRYMSRQLVDQLVEAGDVALGGKSQQATVLFSDIREFTTISEQLGARGTVSVLNDYFTDMVEIIFSNDGILDKYIGDALMAVFGTPFPSEYDADNALKVANEMMVALRQFNRRRSEAGDPKIAIGIGISKGEVVAGNIGSLRRMDYTVIGDSVNRASRLEGANKLYGTAVLTDENVVGALKRPAKLREIDLIRVKGQNRAVAIYEALDYQDDESFPGMMAALEAFELGLNQYRQRNWQAALAAFQTALGEAPGDGPSSLYCERCQIYLDNPPPEDWDGVWSMQTK